MARASAREEAFFIERVAVLREPEGDETRGLVWLRDADEPLLMISEDGVLTEIRTPRGDRVELEPPRDGHAAATVYSVDDDETVEVRMPMPRVSDAMPSTIARWSERPSEGMRAQMRAGDVEIEVPDGPRRIDFTRRFFVPVTTRASKTFDEDAVPYTASCAPHICKRMDFGAFGWKELPVNDDDRADIEVWGTLDTADLDPPTPEQYAVMEAKYSRYYDAHEGFVSSGVLYLLGAAGFAIAICGYLGFLPCAASGKLAAAAGITGTVSFPVGIANDLAKPGTIARGAMLMWYLEESRDRIAEELRGIELTLCADDSCLSRSCAKVALPELFDVPPHTVLERGATLVLREKNGKPAPLLTPRPAPGQKTALDPNAHCLATVRLWVRGDLKREVSLALARSRSYPNGYSCYYDGTGIEGVGKHVEVKAWRHMLSRHRHCGQVTRAFVRERRSENGMLSKSWTSTERTTSVTAHSFDRHEVLDSDGERMLQLAVRAGLGEPCRR